jgi:hypothetical protein
VAERWRLCYTLREGDDQQIEKTKADDGANIVEGMGCGWSFFSFRGMGWGADEQT